MFRTVMGFLQRHGFHLKVAGLSIIAGCALLCCFFYIKHELTRELNNRVFWVAFCGLIIYAAGRVLGFLENKGQKGGPETGGNGKDPL